MAAGLKDGTVLVWEMPSARPLYRLSGLLSEVQALAFHPSGVRLSGGGKDDLILTWAMDDGKVVDRQTGHAEPINKVAFDSKIHVIWSVFCGGRGRPENSGA